MKIKKNTGNYGRDRQFILSRESVKFLLAVSAVETQRPKQHDNGMQEEKEQIMFCAGGETFFVATKEMPPKKWQIGQREKEIIEEVFFTLFFDTKKAPRDDPGR